MNKLIITALVCFAPSLLAANEIVSTDAYRWTSDSIIQGEYSAWVVSPYEIRSTYSAQPGYFMPIEKSWKLKNDISAYPVLSTSNGLMQAVYNMALDEMINAVEPDTTLRTGKEWAGVWTRDVSYSIILSMAALQPEASMISLKRKVNTNGRIIQDTGSGGAWPVSTDRMVWALAAYELYKVTGDRDWLKYAYQVVRNTIEDDTKTIYSPDGLVRGETSFIDWREQSYPRWMQTADIYQSEAMGTNVVHAAALNVLSEMASELGYKQEASKYKEASEALAAKINEKFMMPSGYYGMYSYGRDNLILNPRAETLGESLAIIYDIASPSQAVSITENLPVTPFGAAIFYPQIADMPSYHNNALWPFVASYWALANAKAGNEKGTLEAIGSVMRPAALFATNKENFRLDNGDIATELNSSNMLWSLSGNLALTNRLLFGINFDKDGLKFAPFIPKALADTRKLENYPYRGAKLNITVKGYGSEIKSLTLNGKALNPDAVIPAKKIKGVCNIEIVMADNELPRMSVNHVQNTSAPLTPITWIAVNEATGEPTLYWNPIEYIAGYVVLKDGKRVATTRQTSFPLNEEGEWQIIGVSDQGIESFASEPRSNRRNISYQLPGESESFVSEEISYRGNGKPTGYRGNGFVEISHENNSLSVPIDVATSGRYAIKFRYANGNGPVNTENKCAIRSVYLNGEKVGTVVLPQRGVGNWDDWGITNSVIVDLPAGVSTLQLNLNPENENMNLKTNHALVDEVILTPITLKNIK